MHTLLVADDSVTVQRVLALSFAGQPFDVIVAKDGQDAIDRMAHVRPDIVLADTNMPCVDGYGVAQWVRQQPHLAGVPVLLLAGAPDPVDEQRLQSSGAAGVLEKPFEPTHVIDRVKELLGLKSGAPATEGGRLITAPPIKVVRPPEKPAASAAVPAPEPVPEAPVFDLGAPSAVPAPAGSKVEEPVSDLRAALDSLETRVSSGTEPAPAASISAYGIPEAPTGTAYGSPEVAAAGVPEAPVMDDTASFEAALAPEAAIGTGAADAFASLLAQEQGAENLDDMAARLEERLRLPEIRQEMQQSMTVAVNDAVAAALRESVAAEVGAALRALHPAMEHAIRESIASVLPAALAEATNAVREDVRAQVASAVAAAIPAAVAEASAGPLGASVRDVVLETSERLVRDEIARIRGMA